MFLSYSLKMKLQIFCSAGASSDWICVGPVVEELDGPFDDAAGLLGVPSILVGEIRG